MKTLIYNELHPARIPNFKKVVGFLERDDFRSAEVKKIGDNLYRAKLDKSNRLLFALHQHNGERYALILEWIEWHAYDKSRFLRGAEIDETKIADVPSPDGLEHPPLVYVNPEQPHFHILDKILSFDQAQATIYRLQPPLIVIGSAGSGKTALTLEKMKQATGDILYVTRSPYLVHNSRQLYFGANYANEHQNIDFLSFQEYLESIQVPEGRELTYREFAGWMSRHRLPKGLQDAHQMFEEFKGVLTGPATDAPWLSREEYLALGVKQSIFPQEERGAVHDLFLKYLDFMREQGRYDANILSFQYLDQVEPSYDFVVVDEVQDLTNVQLRLILKSLRDKHQFLLCGDSNQIVHPNFFSWSKVKSYFYQEDAPTEKGRGGQEIIRILNTNYRNSPEVTEVANRVLKIKNARFGSVDKESNYLVKSNAHNQGVAVLLRDEEKVKREIDQKTRASTRFAVLVMHPEQKAAVKAHFRTPLVFSVQEAKGLEYENIILFNFVSADAERFREIARGVQHEDLLIEELHFARAKDKGDKSLEIYKFHINALYVAITRAVKNIYLIESSPDHRLFDLLGIQAAAGGLALEQYGSTLEEWRAEAHRLELQGKQEQAEEIRSAILKEKKVPWTVLTGEALAELDEKAKGADKKAKLRLFEYALVYHDQRRMNALFDLGFHPAQHPEKGEKELIRNHYMAYDLKHTGGVLRQADEYGTDFRNPFNQTPLMIAARMGKEELIGQLIERGADTELVNNAGLNAFQIALEQALADPKYAKGKLPAVYQRIEPDSLSVQVDGRLVKLDNRQAEFLIFNLMMVLFYARLGEKTAIRPDAGFESKDFVEALAQFPERLVPEYRKKRQYLSAILSKNEAGRQDRYNRKLFVRVRQGHYLINPNLQVRVEGEWRGIYDLLRVEMLAPKRIDPVETYGGRWYDPNAWRNRNVALFQEAFAGWIERAKAKRRREVEPG
jgi:hypothetical protein